AVDPYGARAKQPANPNREVPGCSARGNHHVGTFLKEQREDSPRGSDQSNLVPSVGIWNHAEIGTGDIVPVTFPYSGIDDVTAIECRPEAQHLHPEPTAGGRGENLCSRGDVYLNWKLVKKLRDREGPQARF